MGMKNIPNKTVALFKMKLSIIRHNTGSILPTMLENHQAIIEILYNLTRAADSENAAHIRAGWLDLSWINSTDSTQESKQNPTIKNPGKTWASLFITIITLPAP